MPADAVRRADGVSASRSLRASCGRRCLLQQQRGSSCWAWSANLTCWLACRLAATTATPVITRMSVAC